jgi:hypothetical protein
VIEVKKIAVVILALALLMLILASTFVVAVPVQASSTNTFTVSPSGGDDTANIQGVFDSAVAAGPGSTVQLAAGQFYCTNIIVKDFYGTMKGAGKGLTKIDVLQGLYPTADPIKKVWTDETGELNPTLFVFIRGDITISDLTFDITPYAPGELYTWEGFYFQTLFGIVLVTGNTVDSRFERVGFIGHEGQEQWLGTSWNVVVAIQDIGTPYHNAIIDDVMYWWGAPTSGTHIVTNCEFDHVEWGVSGWGLTDGRMIVGGGKSTGNIFNDVAGALPTTDMDNSAIEFSYNYVWGAKYIAIYVWTDFKPKDELFPIEYVSQPSRYIVSHNTIQVVYYADGVGLLDLNFRDSGQKSIDAVISHNKFILDTLWGAIWGFWTQDVVVLNNQFVGAGIAGIYPGAWGDTCNNWLILGNNVQHVDAGVAPIWLGPGTSECTVVGGSTKTNVLDEGTNNRIVGVNNMKGNPPGPEIKNAMDPKRIMLDPPP